MKNIVNSIFLILAFFVISAAPSFAQKTGVLVLAHGGSSTWNETVLNVVKPIKKDYPVEIAFGMADPKTMQEGINKLEAQNVNTIVVIQLFISSYSAIIRQNEYLLGLRDELADEPMIMHHHGGTHGHSSNETTDENETVQLKPLDIKAKVLLTKPLNDHPLVADILLDRIKELSVNPENETLILVAHGPNGEEDNKLWISALNNIAEQIKSSYNENGFKEIYCLTVRDDASKEIYNAAKQEFRDIVSEASNDGSALVVPVLLSRGGVEKGIIKRLEGLKYKWTGNTLLPHENITKFIENSVENALNIKEVGL